MPAVQYPFIDIAVHPRIRERFARGEAMALFSASLDRVLWANGAGADLFGYTAIYDFIEQGAKQGDVSFRQVASTAHQLAAVGDTRGFLIRIAAGFQRIVVNATVEMVRIQAGETAILFSCPVSSKELDTPARARQMLEGFDDPDTHMAVIDRDGEIIASSAGFKALGVTPQTASMLVTMAGAQPERMIKRPIPTGQGYLPAAIGRLSDSPALHLLFVVEMIIGHLDPVDHVAPATVAESVVAVPAAEVAEEAPQTAPTSNEASSDLLAASTKPQPEQTEALADTLEAISAADLPTEAAIEEKAAPYPELAAAPHALQVEQFSPHALPDTIAAIAVADLPTEPGENGEPDKANSNEQTDAHDLGPETIGYPNQPGANIFDTASVEEPALHWATSDIPAIAGDDIPAFVETAAQFSAEVAGPVHDDAATEIPLVQAADLVHYAEPEARHLSDPVTDTAASEDLATTMPAMEQASSDSFAFATMIDAVANIEDFDDALEDIGNEGAETDEAVTLPAAAGEALVPSEKTEPASSAAAGSEMHDTVSSSLQDIHTAEAREKVAREATAFLAALSEHDPFQQGVKAPIESPQTTETVDKADIAAAVDEITGKQEELPAEIDTESFNESAEPVEVETAAALEANTSQIAPEETPKGHGLVKSESDVSATEAEQAVLEDAPAEAEEPVAEPSANAAADSTESLPPADIDTPAGSATDASPEAGFTFNRNGRATRFVWKIDAEGRFSEISREFAEAVGPHAKSVTGVAFTDIAALFNLDPDGKISELLARRDTWSGRTIHWPVEGTTLTVPVDLAALPTYTRSREFDGFRGFGVVRLSDAAEDPQKIGLTLTDNIAAPIDAAKAVDSDGIEPPSEHDAVEKTVLEDSLPASDIELPTLADAPEADEPELPFNGEPPALKISEGPSRRLSDKIIQLHQHRLNISDSLSPSEQAAFREIGKQLEPFGKRSEPPAEAATGDATSAAEHEASSENSEGALISHVAANDDNRDAQEASSTEPADKNEEGLDPLAVLSTAIPPRSKMTDGLSAEIVDQLPVAVLVHAGDTLIHANPEFLRLTGYQNLTEVAGIGGLDALLQRQDLEDKTERPGAMMVVRADDALVPVTARLQSIRWEDGSALMLALMPVEKHADVVDTAARIDNHDEARPDRMLEKVAKLQVEVEELQSILETATDGVAIIGPEGDIRSMNRSASALFNYDEQETRGKPFVMLFAHESQKAVLDYLNGLTGNGVASVLNDGREVIGREASGGFVPLFMTMGVLTSSNGYCAVIRDITQWKRTEEELRNAKRAAETANAHKSDFLARVSHEIRTPLNAIIGFSDMMASERLGPIGHPRYAEYAGDIGRSGRHVLDIVNDLLDISKIEAGEMDLEFGSVGLNAAIAEAVSIVQPQANGQRVIIRTALAQSVPNVVADLRSIKQIALNILSNAIRFTPSGGQIVVSTSYEGNGSVVLRIRDTGVGMTRTELEQAMKPFRQVATNSRQRGDGTGLGLPLTKAMVDANRALFAIHSAPNEGTLVEVTFPSQRVLAN